MTTATSPSLADILRTRWPQSPYPIIVDHRHGEARLCPAPTLYLGARRWAQGYAGRYACGDVIDIAAEASATTLMQIIGALRTGVQVHLHPHHRGRAMPSPGGLSFPDGSILRRARVRDHFCRPQARPRRWWSLGDWSKLATWDQDLLPALALGAELHINLHGTDQRRIAEEESWPDVIGSWEAASYDMPVAIDRLPTPWIFATNLGSDALIARATKTPAPTP
ncbi:MAG: hypothetical protein AAFN74_10390 [Myxococcota bacterium]